MAGQQFRFAPLGIAPDLTQSAAPPDVWTIVRNAYARNGMERPRGVAEIWPDQLVVPRWLLPTRSATSPYFWLYGHNSGIGGTDGANFDLTPVGFVGNSAFNVWSGGNLNDVPVMCNGAVPWWWDGLTASPLAVLPGWPVGWRTRAIRPFKYHLIAMDVDAGTGDYIPDLLHWSAAAAPGTVPASWVPSAANEAGSAQLSSTPGGIVDGAPLRGTFVIYKETSAYIMQYVGGANVMNVSQLFSDVGILTRNCIAELENLHVVLTDGDVIAHDGQTAQSIADSTIRRTLLQVIDASSQKACFVFPHTPPGEVWICVPEPGATYPTIAAVWDRQRAKWGVRDLTTTRPSHIAQGVVPYAATFGTRWVDGGATTWAETTWAWEYSGPSPSKFSLMGASSLRTVLVTFDQTNADLGAIVRGSLERRLLDFASPDTVKTVRRVWIKAAGPTGCKLGVQIAGSLSPGEQPTYGPIAYVEPGVRMDAPLYATGRYISIKITDACESVLQPWRINDVTFEFDERGMF